MESEISLGSTEEPAPHKHTLGLQVLPFFFFFQERISLCSPRLTELTLWTRAGLQLKEIFLAQPPECWN